MPKSESEHVDEEQATQKDEAAKDYEAAIQAKICTVSRKTPLFVNSTNNAQ